ncbi:iron ABC transporter permease [Deinococcus sp. KNUC1210]|uniref:ABC transporter permease n=1 Tax=Deinococcus sp. KNUC1210 TaxID=2917691 RepID=UPI001EF073E7|nr:iron ABC transporter permease [Deinococcus sp. KNUC1210]ULH16536.1 iron ABC transporter permease [Deinococcus sp. KNUC1210]
MTAQPSKASTPGVVRPPLPLGWWLLMAAVGLAVLSPLLLLLWQSLLNNPFFAPVKTVGVSAYTQVLSDPAFWRAFGNSGVLALAMIFIAVPLGALLAFLVTKTDLPFAKVFEVLLLTPIFVSPIVLGVGFIVSLGPSGFVSAWFKALFHLDAAPWSVYTLPAIALIAGLTHVPYVYLYVSTTMKNLDASLEEAARLSGAGVWKVMTAVTLPLVRPALVYSAMLMLLLGFEIFGLPLVLGDARGVDVITTYLYRLTAITGVPAYGPMAVVAMILICMALVIVFMQRFLTRTSGSYVSLGSKGYRAERLKLGGLRWPLALIISAYLLYAVVTPMAGVLLRSLVRSWGPGVNLFSALTLANYQSIFSTPDLARSVLNTLMVALVGGAAAVAVYLFVALGIQRAPKGVSRTLDYLAGLPRAVPGLIMGLALFWLFIFVPVLKPIRPTLLSIAIAYTIVWMPYGVRLITAALGQVSRDLEEAARISGATATGAFVRATLPVLRPGLIAAWLLIFMQFVREYSSGVYLLSPGTEVLGAQIVQLWSTGAVDAIAALSSLQIIIIVAVYAIATRIGVRPG